VLVLVRHGRTAANAERKLQGHLDLPLDDVGMAQVAEVAVGWTSPDRVISSPLVRARQTAEAFGMPYEVDDRWIELDYGTLDGVPTSDVGP
jgi:broad specificity phosphatase PhoE